MAANTNKILTKLSFSIEKMLQEDISTSRKDVLQVLINYIQGKLDRHQEINLNFICTHNSRRSQFAQLWAQTAAHAYEIPVNCYSGGVEVTDFNVRAVEAIKMAGFNVEMAEGDNPRYSVSFAEGAEPLTMFSKLFDDEGNPTTNFAAIMTCSHADENCPYIPGTEQRIPLLYDDPKEFDGTEQEAMMYDARSRQIATELFYVFSQITK